MESWDERLGTITYAKTTNDAMSLATAPLPANRLGGAESDEMNGIWLVPECTARDKEAQKAKRGLVRDLLAVVRCRTRTTQMDE
ncbi:hypothetical protein VTL71DRAFT_12731, partial [Oculimacula yallundae]